MEGLMNYGVQMGSGAMIQIPSIIKFSSGIQELIPMDSDTQKHRAHGNLTSLLLFFIQNKESNIIF
jgi:hypothetical protein